VPAHDRRGSNCIACSPPALIGFRFGNDSFAPHLAEARRRGVRPSVLDLPGLGLDIDNPRDLAAFLVRPSATRARRYLDAIDCAARLKSKKSS
jgi:2-phospho-L-lactate/phosphoenolpyruvate guanylyltransferase